MERKLLGMIFKKQTQKIFCIGNNKTGTTSLEKFFKDHDYNVANQREAELLLDDYVNRNWKPIIQYCKKYEVFQDIPFSMPYLYVILDHIFPNSKFILSVRDTPEQWYNSISKFHGKLFGKNGELPTKEDLQNGNYIQKGWIWEAMKERYGDYENPYDKDRLIKLNENYNDEVRNYFKNNSNFLEINVSDENAVQKLSNFLGIEAKYNGFPHENKT